MPKLKSKKPIVNAHAHIFTHKHVPPFLAKTLVFWPFYYLIHVPTFVGIYKLLNRIKTKRYRTIPKKIKRFTVAIKRFLLQHFVTRILYWLVILWLGITCFFILFHKIDQFSFGTEDAPIFVEYLRSLSTYLEKYHLIFRRPDWWPIYLNIAFAFLILLFIKSVRKAILFLLNQVRSFLHLLPGKKTKALMARYLMMARFAIYGRQRNIYSRLKRQYPQGSHFIILPMDMEYMGAGKPSKSEDYYSQLSELADLNKKQEVHPFIFIDPRRIRDEKKGKAFLDLKFEDDKIILNDSIVKNYIEDEKFSGFKIYPALGYFPFDEDLLPLWKYAVDNNLPIMTHGVKGVIYYRGRIEKKWNHHPVFTEYMGDEGHVPLSFKQFSNAAFQSNFTHPMNFLCLLEEPLLRKLVGEGKSDLNRKIFGYTDQETPLTSNLSKLKICYAHYGGSEEWNKFLERDRDNYAQQLMAKPKNGIVFGRESNGKMPWGRYENVWKYTDWYSIISSMMIQYDNFYADISYIVSNPSLYPMLRSTISSGLSIENYFTKELTYESKEKLRNRVLFGSDFYVVRSQKSDKDIFIELKSYLTEEEFDLVARENPDHYLNGNDSSIIS